MSDDSGPMSSVFRLRLPATSANLGPGFDAVAVALDFYLEIEAEPAEEFSIAATGRDRERCARLDDNLILEIYKELLTSHEKPIVPLAIRMVNGIPLGMGCGSSAAGRLAAVALAVHFGQLGWSSERILEEACVLEGHPDNAAACWLGGLLPRRLKAEPCMWRGLSRLLSGGPLLCCPQSHWQPAKPARCCPRATLVPMQWLTSSLLPCWDSPLRRGGAICCALP